MRLSRVKNYGRFNNSKIDIYLRLDHQDISHKFYFAFVNSLLSVHLVTGTYRRVCAMRDAFEGSFDTNR